MEGSEAVGFSHSEFGLVVEALHDAAGELLFGMEVVQDERSVRASVARSSSSVRCESA